MLSSGRTGRLSLLLIVLMVVLGCNALNPLCGSARPAPVLNSISPTTVALADLGSSLALTANGSHFVAASTVVFNGTIVTTTVVSSTQVTVAIPASMITAIGSYNVTVQTPGGNSSMLGCSSGGTSSEQTLTVD